MAKQPVIDKNKCLGCGTCVALASKTFKLGAEGKAQVVNPSGDNEETIQSAIDSCPAQAISWKEE